MDILQQLNQIAQERDLPLSELQRELEEALGAAYKRYVGSRGEVSVKLDPKKGWTALVEKEVVAVVTEPSFQISLVEAKKRDDNSEIGDFVAMEVDPNRFGRIAAQTAKQVLSQKLREAETRRIHDVFSEIWSPDWSVEKTVKTFTFRSTRSKLNSRGRSRCPPSHTGRMIDLKFTFIRWTTLSADCGLSFQELTLTF